MHPNTKKLDHPCQQPTTNNEQEQKYKTPYNPQLCDSTLSEVLGHLWERECTDLIALKHPPSGDRLMNHIALISLHSNKSRRLQLVTTNHMGKADNNRS